MKHEQQVVFRLVPKEWLMIYIIGCVILLALPLWPILDPERINVLPLLTSIVSVSIYSTVKFGTYRLIFYNDRIVSKVWRKRRAILYSDISKIVTTVPRNEEIFGSLNVWVFGKGTRIYFRNDWFNTKISNNAIAFLMEQCPQEKIKGELSLKEKFFVELFECAVGFKWLVIIAALGVAYSYLLPYITGLPIQP